MEKTFDCWSCGKIKKDVKIHFNPMSKTFQKLCKKCMKKIMKNVAG